MKPICVIDAETSGLNPEVHSILTLGIVLLDLDLKEVNPLGTIYIKEPSIVKDPRAMEVNKITDDMIESSRPPKESVKVIKDILSVSFPDGDVIIGGWNTPFDVAFLQRLWRLAYGDDWFDDWSFTFNYKIVDAAAYLPLLHFVGRVPHDKTGLNKVLSEYGINNPMPHSAIHDAYATARLILNIFKETDKWVKNLKTTTA